MGYLRDQEGIMHRFLREGEGWQAHLHHSKGFISSAFQKQDGERNSPESLAVLGSGWLLDLPLKALQERFNHIYLVDVHHPPQVRKKVKGMARVSCLEADLSGGALAQAWAWSREKPTRRRPFSEVLQLGYPLDEIRPEAFVSLNLMNQLDILLCDFLEKSGLQSPDALLGIRQKIQANHLEWIRKKPACLITDVLERNTDHKGQVHERPLIHVGLPECPRMEAWDWAFDHSGNYHSGQHTTMKVRAMEWP